MGNINWGRLILGGIVAAIILFVVDYILNGVILASQWSAAMTALGKPETPPSGLIIVVIIINLLIGLAALWIYTGIRPRYGAGVMTAIYAGLAVWVLAFVVSNLALGIAGLLPASILWTSAIVGLIAVPVATVAGAYLYKE